MNDNDDWEYQSLYDQQTTCCEKTRKKMLELRRKNWVCVCGNKV
jgi:hypothetical protein